MDMEFQFGKMKKFWKWMVVKAAQLCRDVLNATEPYTKNGLYIFYHNFVFLNHRRSQYGKRITEYCRKRQKLFNEEISMYLQAGGLD